MINLSKYLVILILTFVSFRIEASANTFIREIERLVAYSDKTYTVIVSQYEQTYVYSKGINRLIIRVIDISTNGLISELLISSVQSAQSLEEPFEITFSPVPGESPAINNGMMHRQTLYNNLEYPKYRFHIDELGIYINNNGRQDILDLSVVESRFSKAGSNLNHPLDSNFDLKQAINSNNLEFTGWYKTDNRTDNKTGTNGYQRFFLVLKLGRYDDDTGGLEYVFSIPDK